MELITPLSLCCIVLGILQTIQTAPLDNDNLNDENLDEFKRYAIPWLDENHDIDTRGKNNEKKPEFIETVNSSFGYFDENSDFERNLDESLELNEQPDLQTRGSSKVVSKVTVYLPNGKPNTFTVEKLCLQAHNYFRKKHRIDTFSVKYDSGIAKSAEEYSLLLANNGKFEHDRSVGGKLGENLYRMDNTYGLIATPIHAIMAWYEESWQPLTGSPRNYNYKWNPKNAQEFHDAGVGHFTQMIWDDAVQIGCGAATTTFDNGGRKWTRTVITTRYRKPGNWLGVFPNHVFPLKKGTTLQGSVKRGRLYPVKTKCVNTMPKSECEKWKGYDWCGKDFAKRDCYCTCVQK